MYIVCMCMHVHSVYVCMCMHMCILCEAWQSQGFKAAACFWFLVSSSS